MLGMSCDFIQQYVQAGKRSCPSSKLKELASSRFAKVRMRVAENERTPTDVLEQLSHDDCAEVRIAVGTNFRTKTEVAQKLASDEDINVRLGLAESPLTPIELLMQLSEDENPYVSSQAKKGLVFARARELNAKNFSSPAQFRGPDNLRYA